MRRTKIAASLLLAALALASEGFATPPKRPYTVPSGGLKFGDFQVVSWNPAQSGIFKCVLSSAVATLSELDIKFDSSPDLKVEPASAEVPALQKGEKKEFQLRITKISAEKNDVMGTWVRVTVKYLPDYAALRQWVQAEPKRFSIYEGYLRNVLDTLKERESQGKKEIFSQRSFIDAMLPIENLMGKNDHY